MVALLGFILDGVELIGTYALWAIETGANAIFAAVGVAAAAAFALLPAMPDSSSSIGTPTWLGWLSWFYPVGDLLAGLVTISTLWIAFLAVRYVLRLVRAI